MSNDSQQITPFDGYGGGEMAEYQGGAGGGALGRPGMNMGGMGMGGMGGMGGDGGAAAGGLLRKVHNSLRGRYWIGLAVGAVLGGLGGWFGYWSQFPVYRGEGMIQIAMNKPIVDPRGGDSGGFLPNHEEYIQSQAMMITSRRVIEDAMKSREWEKTGLDPTDKRIAAMVAANLSVEHPSRTEIIKVYYTDRNDEVAKAVVNAVVLAYNSFAVARSQGEDMKRVRLLDERRVAIWNQIQVLERQILDAAQVYGSADLGTLVEAKLTEETKIESERNKAELALGMAKRKKDARGAINEFSENQVGMIDTFMRNLLMERDQIGSDIARGKEMGLLPGNTKMKQLASLLESQQKKIDRYMVEWRDLQMKLADDPTLTGTGIARVLQLSEKVLEGEVKSLTEKYEQLKKERTEIGRHMLKIQDLQRQREEAIKDKADIQTRMNVLAMESGMGGRVTVINPGDVSLTPFKDRRKMYGAAGALGGFGFPMALLVLVGLIDKRYRYSDEANDGVNNVPLLGILPRLPDKLSDPEQAAVAAHCIHQIRIMLQVGPSPESRRVFMVTSASTGDGKTSLTMALGLSFAASGSKTLVIDCDMVGQGLTHRLKAHSVPGLIETLNLGTLRGHVRKTATKGLYILPIGSADAVHAGVLSPQSIKRLLAACREHFDVIVIDTGPILGSLEASVVAQEADGVILAVARGQHQPLVEKAIKHLRSVGATIFGIVFNRAEQRDFQRSVASASIRSASAKPTEARALLPESDESARFGPLARSVASCLPASATHAGSGNGNGVGGVNGNGNGFHGNGDA
jgi:capsular exopolysaccharide synthesis family protein